MEPIQVGELVKCPIRVYDITLDKENMGEDVRQIVKEIRPGWSNENIEEKVGELCFGGC